MAKNIQPKPEHEPIVMIVEGPDLSGKSTLVDALVKEYPGIMLKVTKRPVSKNKMDIIGFKKYLYSALDYVNHNRQTKIIIFDRFFPSEMVYSMVKRGYEAYHDRDYVDMERVIKAREHLYIYCCPGIDSLTERYKSRGDEHVTPDDLLPLVERYDRFYDQTRMNKIKLDTTQPIEQLLEQIKSVAK